MSAARCLAAVEHITAALGMLERTVCCVLGQHRSPQRKPRRTADDEAALTQAVVELAQEYGRYDYRRITALLRAEGWHTNNKRRSGSGALKACRSRVRSHDAPRRMPPDVLMRLVRPGS